MEGFDLFSLIIVAFVWVIIWSFFKYKYPLKRVGILYLTMYVVMFLLSIDLYHRSPYDYNNQNLFALIHYVVIITLFTLPLAEINFDKIKIIHPCGFKVNIVSIFIIIFSLLGIDELMQNFSTGIVGLLIDEDYGAQMYHELRNSSGFDSKSGFGFSSIVSVIANITKGTAPLFSLYYLSRPKKNLFITIGLLLSTFLIILNGISTGSRFAIISSLMNIISFLYVMNHFYSDKIKKVVNTVVISVAALSVVGTVAITISRAGRGNYDPLESVEKYISQANLIYGKFAFDAGGVRYADRTFPLIKSLFASDVARTYTDRLNKYSYMKVNESRFISFVGDFMLDFGPIFGTLILLLIYLWLKKKLKPRMYIGLDYLIVVYLAIENLNGFYSYQFVDFGGNLHLVFLLILYVFFKNGKKCKSIKNSNLTINV